MTEKKANLSEKTLSRRKLLTTTGASSLAFAAGCLGSEDGDSADPGASAAWIYFADAGDQGWTASHDTGREATEGEMGDLVTDYVENVDAADVEQTASQFAEDGYDIIFAASASYTDPIARASEQYPDTAFEVASGIDVGDNYGSYYLKNYHGRYLCGYAAGMLTENDRVGYIAANPVATVYQDINGFASGLMDANEDATLHLRWTNAWYDPPTEGENAQALINDEDVDVMAQHQDSASALETAADNGIWASGYAEPMRQFGGDQYLTTPTFNWEAAHIPLIEAAAEGEWEAGRTFPGIEEGAVGLSDWGPDVPDDVINEVESIKQDMESGGADEIVWGDTVYEDWSEEEIQLEFDTLGIDNIEGDEL